jgi:signal transduction histidine kinase/DNA-binding response OmpR family regulator/ligand-binding sensor domain-containing protein
VASPLTFNKGCISLLILACFAGTFASGIETRSMDSYRVDPLSETWRWQRIRSLETGDIVLAEMAPDGTMGIVSSPNRFRIYDGFQSELVEFPEDLPVREINALAITSKGMYCLASSGAVVLYDGETWTQVVDSGLGQRATDIIIETPDGSLWAGLDDGLARIDPLTGHSAITRSPKPVMSLCEGPDGNSIRVSLAPYGEIWECPIRDGHLVPAGEWIQRRGALKFEVLSTSLLQASDGRIWFINDHHNLPTSVFDPATGDWEDINLSKLGGDNFDFSILETPDGAIWISSRGSLHILKNGKWTVYHSPEYPLPGARSTMVQDTAGTVTIIEASGMNVQVDYGQRQGLSFENLHFQDETAHGELLFISIDDEVVHWAKGAQEAQFHPADETGITSPTALLVHSTGDWILSGSTDRQAAVSIFDGARWQAIAFPEIGLSFGHLALLERPNGEVWLGCAQLEVEFPDFEGGIVVLTPDGAGGYSISKRQPPAYSFRNWSLQKDAAGRVFTSGNGLFQNTDAGAVPIEMPDLIRYKWIDQIALDSVGDIWTAIWSIGVFRLHDGEWTQFSETNGLESNLTSFVISLGGADPVVSTREGHYRFDGQGWAPFMGNMDGLHRGSGRVTEAGDGSIWINHTHVDWYYRGQRAEAYSEDKKRGFRTLQYVPDAQPPDTQWATPPPELLRNTDLAFEWKGIDAWSRTHVDNLQFSYRIDGGEWSPFRPSTELDLDQMEGGRHTIEVRSRDTDFNIDPTPLRAEFTVILPLWRQAWFIASLLAGLVFVIAVVTLFIRQRVRHLLEIEQVKLRFFTHLSHEIKTPLSLILGPVERLQNEVSDGRHQHYLSLIKSNSQRLLFLVNQLLDFRKFQLNKLDYEPEEADFIPFARSCLAVFDGWTREKGQTLTLETELEEFIFPFPHEMFHKIIDNLVNNAIKYTPAGGRISVRVDKRGRPGQPLMGVIEVEDNGPGIPASEQKAVFEPFYRSATHDQLEEGSGIGLAFVKELVDSIDGTIELTSPVNPADPEHPGSRFRVIIPIPKGKSVPSRVPKPAELPEQTAPVKAGHEPVGPSSSLILLVEDNHDLRDFISGELKGSFQIEAAEDAAAGFRKARELIPDLVITDVVMPGKSGFDLCNELKQEPHTSHIPVILLTALRSEKHKLQAYESGADDFITKPVSPEILRLKVRNLLATQQHSREKVRQQFVDDNRVTGVSEADQAFLDKARAIVEQELSNEQFDVNALAEKMGYSRSAFYRKFNSLTDLSPAAFIRTRRLRKAAKWLAEGDKSVSEIAYDLGFSDAGYFSRVFKDEYKCSPSEFAKKDAV